jgi:PilZ domain
VPLDAANDVGLAAEAAVLSLRALAPEYLVQLGVLVYSSLASSMKVDTERRSGRRISTRVPTRLRTADGADQTAQTRDVSSNGVFLYTKSRMEKGTDVELVLILPPELTSGEKCWVCCQATIVRVEEEGTEFGVAAQIRRMDILPEVAI